MSAAQRWYHVISDVGRKRDANEDSHAEYALGDGSVLLVVADGMGGHAAGDVASGIAVAAIGHIFQHSPATDPREKLRTGFQVANQRILAEAERNGTPGMGTTAVAAYVRGAEAFIAHVGDSRFYHVRAGSVHWQTKDHTRVQKMIEMGILAPEQAKGHPDANVVSRALGHAQLADGSTLEPDVKDAPIALVTGDSLVLCSDGLYDDVTNEEIAGALGGRTAGEAALWLVDLANQRGGHDNITVTVLHYGAERGTKAPRLVAAPMATPAQLPRRVLSRRMIAAIGALIVVVAVAVVVMLWLSEAAKPAKKSRPPSAGSSGSATTGDGPPYSGVLAPAQPTAAGTTSHRTGPLGGPLAPAAHGGTPAPDAPDVSGDAPVLGQPAGPVAAPTPATSPAPMQIAASSDCGWGDAPRRGPKIEQTSWREYKCKNTTERKRGTKSCVKDMCSGAPSMMCCPPDGSGRSSPAKTPQRQSSPKIPKPSKP